MADFAQLFAALGGLAGLAGLVTAVVTARNSARAADLRAFKTTIAALERENTRLRACISTLEADRDADRREIAVADAALRRLAGQIESLKRENGRLRRRIEELEAENARLRGTADVQ